MLSAKHNEEVTLDDVEYLTACNVHQAMEHCIGEVLDEKPVNCAASMCEKLLKWGDNNAFSSFVKEQNKSSRGESLTDSQHHANYFSKPGSLEGVLAAIDTILKKRDQSAKEMELVSSIALATNTRGGLGKAATWFKPKPKGDAEDNSSHDGSELKVDTPHSPTPIQIAPTIHKSSGVAQVLLETCLECSSHQIDHVKLVQTLIQSASKLLEADRCTFFLLEGDELVSKIAEGTSEIRLPIGGGGIASCVAKTGEVINLPDAYSDPRFNRSIDQKTGYRTKSLLCAPVLYRDSVIAVVQLLNKRAPEPIGDDPFVVFEDSDVSLFGAFASFAGVFLANSYHYREVALEKRKNEVLLDVVQRVNKTDLRKWNDIAEVIREGCTELLQAERCTLYLVDKEAGVLCATSGDTEIKMPLNQGIAGFVCSSGETVNIPDAYCDPRFNPDVDAATGYVTKTILCVPVVADGEVVAVAQVINKYQGEFTEGDEELLAFFAAFSGLHLSNAKLLEFCRTSGESAMRLLNSQQGVIGGAEGSQFGIKLATETEAVHALSLEMWDGEFASVLTDDFNVHNYGLKTDSFEKLIPLGVMLFEVLGHIERFKVDKVKLARFLLTAASKYRAVPYHNFVHAFDVFQNIFLFLTQGKVKELITELDSFVILVAAIVHDIDHMGVNNSFHSKSETPLGLLSNASGASSVLEVHHCNLAIAMLGIHEIELFSGLSADERVWAYKLLINSILSTDMAKHGEVMAAYDEIFQAGYDKENSEHRKVACAVLLKAGDLSNLTRQFNISRLWGIAITTEFYLQGDSERAQGKSVTPGFDRTTKQELAHGQIGFIKNVGLPFFTKVVNGCFKGLSPYCAQVESNLAKWESIVGK